MRRGRRAPWSWAAAPRCRADAGGAMVELGLTLPLLVGLCLGTVTSGVAVNQRIQMDHAVREAARYGATVPPTQTFANGDGWATNVSSVVRSRSAGELDVAGAVICVAMVQGSGAGVTVVSGPFSPATYTTKSDGSPCDKTETYPVTLYDSGRRVQVRVSRPAQIQGGFTSWDFTISSNSTAKSESGS